MDWNICGLDDLLRKYSSETLATMIFLCIFAISNTVRLVQLVEHQIVVLGVVGSSPTSHPLRETVTEFIEVTVSFVLVTEPIDDHLRRTLRQTLRPGFFTFSVSRKGAPESAHRSRRSCSL